MIENNPAARRKINNLAEIYDGKNLLFKEFINMDLSGIDLSNIPKEKWGNCLFYNTSFKNTGIRYIPNKLASATKEQIETLKLPSDYNSDIAVINCDFSDNDLTYLKHEDFAVYQKLDKNKYYYEVKTCGCDFSNTGINYLNTLINIKLDTSYKKYGFDDYFWAFDYGTFNWPDYIDINTIIKNPFLNVPSFRVLNAIAHYVYDRNQRERLYLDWELFDDPRMIEYVKEIVNNCEKFLEYDKQGYGKKFYNKLLPFMNLRQRFEFFIFLIRNLNLKNIDFEDIPAEVLRYYTIQNNKFENITFNYTMTDLLKIWGGSEHFLDTIRGYENTYKEFYLPMINYNSWQENPLAKKRISESAITFFAKVYVELSRICNAKCPFCRNETFDKSNYDIEKIIESLNLIKSYINAVVIGGGEPTLRLDDVKKLHESIIKDTLDWHLFTNGSNPLIIQDDYIMDNFKLNLSRHAVNDKENAEIFKIDSDKIMTTNEIEKLNSRNKEVTLNAVCFKGGLDSFEKIINYIKYANDIGCKKVLIQDLQRELSLGNKKVDNDNFCIDASIFPKVREYLKANGFREKYPIYATGGYVSYILKNKDGFSVSLQNYINQADLDKEWPKSIKRAFDLSIDPSGNLYENWNQTSGLVKTLIKRKS